MVNQYLCLVILMLLLGLAKSTSPANLQLCQVEDERCVEESARKYLSVFVSGLPKYGVELLDPLKINSINASEGNLLFTLSDVTVAGLKNCNIIKIAFANGHSKMSLNIQCTATLDGEYILKGSVLVVPIEGIGKIHVDLRSAIFQVQLEIVDKIGKDGKTHWSIKSFQNTFELKEKSDVVFENLFNGNEVLGQAARTLIRENANDVIKEIGSKALEHIIGVLVKNINHFFKAIPMEDLVL